MSAETSNYIPDLSFLDEIIKPEQEEVENPDEARYIINSKTIDKHTVKRTRVKLTPAVCEKCGFDIVGTAFEQGKLDTNEYDLLPQNIKIAVEQALKQHKQIAHSVADNLIISESQLKKTKRYLSGRSMQ